MSKTSEAADKLLRRMNIDPENLPDYTCEICGEAITQEQGGIFNSYAHWHFECFGRK